MTSAIDSFLHRLEATETIEGLDTLDAPVVPRPAAAPGRTRHLAGTSDGGLFIVGAAPDLMEEMAAEPRGAGWFVPAENARRARQALSGICALCRSSAPCSVIGRAARRAGVQIRRHAFGHRKGHKEASRE